MTGVSFWPWFVCLYSLASASVHFRRERVFGGARFSRVVAFDNLTLTLDAVLGSPSLDQARTDARLLKIVQERNVRGNLKLDLLMAGDHSLFEAFLALADVKNAELAHFAVQAYLEAIFDQLAVIYGKQTFFNGHKLDLRLAGVLVITDERDCPLKHSVKLGAGGAQQINLDLISEQEGNSSENITWSHDALRVIAALASWRNLHTDVLPKHDHVIFVTKFDLLSPYGHSSTQGMGFVGKMCDSHESVSVVEDIGALTTSIIAAHELGHNLGAFHDGENGNGCSPRSNFLMSPSSSSATQGQVFENGFLFSECSRTQIERFLEKPESNCLTADAPPRQGKRDLRVSPFTRETVRRLLPGEQFGRSKQCQIAFAPHYGACTQKQYLNLAVDPCRRLWCKNRKEHRFLPCETKSYLPLMDGTECGTGKWCMSGTCVPNPHHDPEAGCVDLNEMYCRHKYNPATMKKFCLTKSFSAICCRQCKKYNSYMHEKFLNVERRFKKKKVPARTLAPPASAAADVIPDCDSNSAQNNSNSVVNVR